MCMGSGTAVTGGAGGKVLVWDIRRKVQYLSYSYLHIKSSSQFEAVPEGQGGRWKGSGRGLSNYHLKLNKIDILYLT